MNNHLPKLKICYVYLTPLTEKNVYLAPSIPCLMAKILKGHAHISVLYSGQIDKTAWQKQNIQSYQYGLDQNNFFRYFSLFKKIYKLASQEKVDLFINVWNHYFLLPVTFAAKLSGKKVIARIAGMPILPATKNERIFKKIKKFFALQLEKLSLHSADHIQVISVFLKKFYISRGQAPSKISVISPGIDTSEFYPLAKPNKNNIKKILFIGRLEPIKGPACLIKAFKTVNLKMKNSQCLVIGQGSQLEELKRLSQKLNIEKSVIFKAALANNQLPSVYNSADLLIVPSLYEGLSRVTLEAFACGLPVVATNVGALPSLINQDKGIIVPPKNTKKLAEAILELLPKDKLRQNMGQKARNFVVKNHSLIAVRKKYLTMFNHLRLF